MEKKINNATHPQNDGTLHCSRNVTNIKSNVSGTATKKIHIEGITYPKCNYQICGQQDWAVKSMRIITRILIWCLISPPITPVRSGAFSTKEYSILSAQTYSSSLACSDWRRWGHDVNRPSPPPIPREITCVHQSAWFSLTYGRVQSCGALSPHPARTAENDY